MISRPHRCDDYNWTILAILTKHFQYSSWADWFILICTCHWVLMKSVRSHGSSSLLIHDEGLTLCWATLIWISLHWLITFRVLLWRFFCNLVDVSHIRPLWKYLADIWPSRHHATNLARYSGLASLGEIFVKRLCVCDVLHLYFLPVAERAFLSIE